MMSTVATGTRVFILELRTPMASSTAFTIGSTTVSFRYTVSFCTEASTSETLLRVWLEESKTKKQWQTKWMHTSDFTTSENAMAKATITDYGTQFDVCLRSSDARKSLSPCGDDGGRVLKLCVPLDASMIYVTTLEYELQMTKVKLDRVDILAARVREAVDTISSMKVTMEAMQEEINRTKGTVGILQEQRRKKKKLNRRPFAKSGSRSTSPLQSYHARLQAPPLGMSSLALPEPPRRDDRPTALSLGPYSYRSKPGSYLM